MDAFAKPKNSSKPVFIRAESGLVISDAKTHSDETLESFKPKMVTETEYWEKYYHHSDEIYEWNDGFLEEKSVSDHENYLMYLWFVEQLRHFLRIHPIAQITGLEIGFRLNLPHKTTIRRPDLGVVLNSNPVPLNRDDHTYQGICDLCVELVSDSSRQEIERDAEIKLTEYQTVGVKEYYILYSKGEPMEFYRLNQQGVYVPIKRQNGDLIQSSVLPGFQFRISDLYQQPDPSEMAFDSVYETFVLPYYQQEKKARLAAEAKVIEERKARQSAEEQNKRLEAELARIKKDSQGD
jgi:Uma2 family endonuclease